MDSNGSPDLGLLVSAVEAAELAAIPQACLKRIGSWRLPPNWSRYDWSEEMKGTANLAAWEAVCEFDPSRGVPLQSFVKQRVLARTLTRFRQEWAYSLRCVWTNDEAVMENGFQAPVPSEELAYQALYDGMEGLSERSRWLVDQLFWEERTEANVGQELGITQRAISKRKQAVLQSLRENLEAKL